MKKTRLVAVGTVLLAATTLFLSSCKKEKDDVANEEELITSVELRFVETGTANAMVVAFRDPDGEGGNPPTAFEEIVLKPNTAYTCEVSFLNESVSPADDITAEVEEEGEDHEVFYIVSGAGITITRTDVDAGGLPLGLISTWQTADASSGTVRVVLKHKPGIKAAGDAVTKGDTDIDLNFTARVEAD